MKKIILKKTDKPKTGKRVGGKIKNSMVSISYHGTSLILIDPLFRTNILLEEDSFYKAISRHGAFDMANVDGPTIARLLKESTLRMTIDTYLWPFTKTCGYYDPKEPSIIYLNQWHFNRSIPSFCNTLVHKIVQAVNADNPQYEFGHGNNSPDGKENTAPYWIGNLAEKIISNEHKLASPQYMVKNIADSAI